jgi:3-phosphoshikimate 1-carboxyvinyltransferase
VNILVRKTTPARGSIQVSGDKSISHRAMLIGSIAHGTTVITNFSQGNDCRSTFNCLRRLGVDIKLYDDRIEVNGRGIRGFNEPTDILDCGNSGTTMRLLSGLLCGQEFTSILTGDDSLRNRPMKRVIEPLTAMNGRIWSRTGGRAPLAIKGNDLRAIEYVLPIASAQVKSALIFAGMLADGVTIIEEPIATRDHTEKMLIKFGADLERVGNRIRVKSDNSLYGSMVRVPGDISSAAFFIVLASILPDSNLMLQKTGMNPTRIGSVEAMRSMGADITVDKMPTKESEPVTDLIINHRSLKGAHIHGKMVPRLIDELPIIAVAATQAEGTTTVSDASELRIKETDRITAIVQELRKMGAIISEKEDGFIIDGPCVLNGAVCSSHNDHRIAMALAIAGLCAHGETIIEKAECIEISFPEFVPLIREVCGEDAIRISA